VAARFTTGDWVQTPFGKGVVREVRNKGRLLVDVHGRALLMREADVTAAASRLGSRRTRDADTAPSDPARTHQSHAARTLAVRDIDLHGLTVAEALSRVERALDDALLADRSELRVIHGRGSGRIRSALHRLLKEIAAVKAFRIDPDNEGVTVVYL
jgi:DNA mismatch repair protein MutS2